MSIVVAHGYSMMYATQKQGTVDGPLSLTVTAVPFRAATYGKVAPSTKAELDQYSVEDDFDLTLLPAGAAWNDAWPPVYWTKVGSRYYIWDGAEWDTATLSDGETDLMTEFDPGAVPGERVFLSGRYPQTVAELETLDPAITFAEGEFVTLTGYDTGKSTYHFDGTAWLPGAAPA